jgi:ligand-binding sensor domain-containing protein
MVLSRIGFWVVSICLATNANAVDPDGDIWAEARGTPVRLVRIQNRKVVEEFTEPDIPAAYGLLADPKDGIWLSLMNGGLARYRQRRLEIVLQPQRADVGRIHNLVVDLDGTIWGAAEHALVGWP